jgi:tight adherence protein B
MIPFTVAALFFLCVVTTVVGLWWFRESRRVVRERLQTEHYVPTPEIVRPEPTSGAGGLADLVTGSQAYGRLSRLIVQAGLKMDATNLILLSLALALVAGILGWLRTGWLLWGLVPAVVAGVLPTLYAVYRRQRRLRLFEEQLPEALDMIARAIRAGNALSGAIRLVGEETPDPVGQEFRQVSEEIRLGMDPGDALARLEERAPVQDMAFFCAAIRIQRGSGGNLAEVLDRLAEVIRERFKILSYARVLAAQHKWAAILIGLSPVFLAVVFQLLQPTYFDAFLTNPIGPYLLGLGLVLEATGFFVIWRIAQIRV